MLGMYIRGSRGTQVGRFLRIGGALGVMVIGSVGLAVVWERVLRGMRR